MEQDRGGMIGGEGRLSVFENGFGREEEAAGAAGAGAVTGAFEGGGAGLLANVDGPVDAELRDFLKELRAVAPAEGLALALPNKLDSPGFGAGVGRGAQLWSLGNRCGGQNCALQPSHRMGEKRTFLQLGRVQTGRVLALLSLPVVTGHSLSKCSSMRTFGSCPGRAATGVEHNGPTGYVNQQY
jgi:hypothetical protein